MDWKEIILTDEFKAYRGRQVEEIVRKVHAELKNVNSERLKGLLDMATCIIKLPSVLIKDEKLNTELNRVLAEDLTDLTVKLVREQITRKETV